VLVLNLVFIRKLHFENSVIGKYYSSLLCHHGAGRLPESLCFLWFSRAKNSCRSYFTHHTSIQGDL